MVVYLTDHMPCGFLILVDSILRLLNPVEDAAGGSTKSLSSGYQMRANMGSASFRVFSWVMGLLDLTAGVGFLIISVVYGQWFSLGWGKCLDNVYDFSDSLMEDLEKKDNKALTLTVDDITWTDLPGDKECVLQKGSFVSPFAVFLPDEAKQCQFKLAQPIREKGSQLDAQTYVIMVPGLGEGTDIVMMYLAKYFARHYGWSSIIVTPPFYGNRMPRSRKFLLMSDSVQEIVVQIRGFICETAALAAYFCNNTSSSRVCLTGFSAGAGVSASAAAIAMLAGADGAWLACVSYAGLQGPAKAFECNVLLEPLLNWEALSTRHTEHENATQTSIRREFITELAKTRLDLLVKSVKRSREMSNRPLELAVCSAISMRNDYFTPHDEDYCNALKTLSGKHQNRLKVLPGGHFVAGILRPVVQRNFIIEAVHELQSE